MYRYRQGDFTPYLYQTNDYGKTWKRIADGTNGIPELALHARRPRRPRPQGACSIAGTEFGLYVSFDDGANWQSLQLNLPRTPVTDIMIYRDDLIVTTQGRGFYDSRQHRRRCGRCRCRTARRRRPRCSSSRRTRIAPAAQLPTFYYWFRDAPTAPVTVEVTNAQGQVHVHDDRATRDAPPRRRDWRGRAAVVAAEAVVAAVRRRRRAVRGRRASASAVAGHEPRELDEPAAAGALHRAAGHRDVGRRRRRRDRRCRRAPTRVKVSSGSWSETQTFRLGGRSALHADDDRRRRRRAAPARRTRSAA